MTMDVMMPSCEATQMNSTIRQGMAHHSAASMP
jgi:hypothetical protein